MHPIDNSLLRSQAGFTLAEMAVVLIIVVLLIGGLVVPLGAQIEARQMQDTRNTLAEVRDALLGYSAAQGRLPCPAQDGATGVEAPTGGGPCANPYGGLVPAVTLGIGPTDDAGYLVDAWGNRIRYAISRDPTGDDLASNAGAGAAGVPRWSFTTAGRMRTTISAGAGGCTGIACLHPDLQVCATGAANAQKRCTGTTLSDGAVALIYSLGPNANTPTGGTSTDESSNPNPKSTTAADRVFVSHEPTGAGAANGEFDDLVIWLSPNVFYNRLITAGQLP